MPNARLYIDHVNADTSARFDSAQLQADYAIEDAKSRIFAHYTKARLRYPATGELIPDKDIEKVVSNLLAMEALRQQRITSPEGYHGLLEELLGEKLTPLTFQVDKLETAVARWRLVAMTAAQAAASLAVLGLIILLQ